MTRIVSSIRTRNFFQAPDFRVMQEVYVSPGWIWSERCLYFFTVSENVENNNEIEEFDR